MANGWNLFATTTLVLGITLNHASAQQVSVSSTSPKKGSTAGNTRLTFLGQNFATNHFTGGNRILLIDQANQSKAFECKKPDSVSTGSDKAICDTPKLPEGTYDFMISVDGATPVKFQNHQFEALRAHTPRISRIFPRSGPPGTLLAIEGLIFTDRYESNKAASINGKTAKLNRVYVGTEKCALVASSVCTDGDRSQSFQVALNSESSNRGNINCTLTGTLIADANATIDVDEAYGRSEPELSSTFVGATKTIRQYQVYPVVSAVSPSCGSTQGETTLSIAGQYLGDPLSLKVYVGGKECTGATAVTSTRIECQSPPEVTQTSDWTGNRGLVSQTWDSGTESGAADSTVNIDDSMVKENGKKGYFRKIKGYFQPPYTGKYKFFIKGKGSGKFSFSETGPAASKVEKASFSSDSDTYWITPATQGSQNLYTLTEGQSYYMEIEHTASSTAEDNSVSVASMSFNHTFNSDMTSAAYQEMQTVIVNSTVVDEVQRLVFALVDNHMTTTQEIQTVTVQNADANTNVPYRLCLYSDCTAPLKAADTVTTVQDALNKLPSLQGESVSLSDKSSNGDKIFDVTFNTSMGNVRELTAEDIPVGSPVSVSVIEATQGQASLGQTRLSLDGKVSPLIPASPTRLEVKDALDVLLGNQCPSTIMGSGTNFHSSFKADFETGDGTNAAQYGGKVTNEDSFCGHNSLKNPTYLAVSSGIDIQQYSKLCFGHKGKFEGTFSVVASGFKDGNLEENKAFSVSSFQIPETKLSESKWDYDCVEVKDGIVDLMTPRLKSIKFMSSNTSLDNYIDAVRFSSSNITATDGEMFKQVRKAALLNGNRINSFDVTVVQGTPNAYDVTFKPQNCSQNIPLLGLAPLEQVPTSGISQLVSGTDTGTLTVSRLSASAGRLSGELKTTFDGTLAKFPVLSTAEEVKQALESQISNIGVLDVEEEGDCANRAWKITFKTKSGDQQQLVVDHSSVTGSNVQSSVVTNRDGFLFFDPIPGDMFRTPATKPQVLTLINGIPAKCNGDCSYEWCASSTPTVTAVNPLQGEQGDVVSLTGTGFDGGAVSVTMGDTVCVVDESTKTPTSASCTLGYGTQGTSPVNVNVASKGKATGSFNFQVTRTVTTTAAPTTVTTTVTTTTSATSTLIDESVYVTSSTTLAIAKVMPTEGGTGGGTLVTIYGSGFGTSGATVAIAGAACVVKSNINYKITCETPSSATSGAKALIVTQGSTASSSFTYIDVWSNPATWTGLPVPVADDVVQIPAGKTILLDQSTPILSAVIIQGTLIFARKNLALNAKYILITDGGWLQVGTETEPFLQQANITLHGNLQSTELPIYGAKVLAVRNGTLDLHGAPITKIWTRLASTALAGSSTLHLLEAVKWKVGSKIVIACTGNRFSQNETETRRITAISADGQTLTLDSPLTNKHLGEFEMFGTVRAEYRAEVGLLSQNVLIQGSNDKSWNQIIAACKDGFDTGEFTTQTCFQGRFGQEEDSDSFGAQIFIGPPDANQDTAVARISNIEANYVGQSNRLGRYPIHFHMVGHTTKSYVRHSSIHRTFNRAINIHATHNLTVEGNVVYHVFGGAIFLEDGVETGNSITYNLVVFVRASSSLLNDDITPASFWCTNANNTYKFNVACCGTHFGWWYRMHDHPDGPSYDPDIYPKYVPLDTFSNNSAHGFGWFGLWVFHDFFPTVDGKPGSNYKKAVFSYFFAWNCEKGSECVNCGATQFWNFLLVGNSKAGHEGKLVKGSPQYTDDSHMFANSTIVAKSSSGVLDLQPEWSAGGCSNYGIVLPFGNGMKVMNVEFYNYMESGWAAMRMAKIDGHCLDYCSGYTIHFSGISFFNTPKKFQVPWTDVAVLKDEDASLNPGHAAGSLLIPTTGDLDPAVCSPANNFPTLLLPMSSCAPPTKAHRFSFNSIEPDSLEGHAARVTNQHGNKSAPHAKKRITHPFGWTLTLMNGDRYLLSFDNGEHVTNITYKGVHYDYRGSDCNILCMVVDKKPDRVSFNGGATYNDEANFTIDCSDPNTRNFDWNFDSANMQFCYAIHAQTRRKRGGSPMPVYAGVDIPVDLSVFKCYFENCVPPVDPDKQPPVCTRPNSAIMWSSANSWSSSATGKFEAVSSNGGVGLPTQDSDVTISTSVWIVLDVTNNLRFHSIFVDKYGTLEVDNSDPTKSFQISVVYMIILGRFKAGCGCEEPFLPSLTIELRGTHATPTYRNKMNWDLGGPTVGAKAIGNFGGLDLSGKPVSVAWTRLAQTANAGQNTLVLQTAPGWSVGSEIVIAPSGYNFTQSEIHKIDAVSADGLTLTLNRSLAYRHISYTKSGTGRNSYTIAAEVGLLTRNIRIVGEFNSTSDSQSFGGRVLVSVTANATRAFTGWARICNVEFYRMGQEGFDSAFDPRHALTFLDVGQNQNFTPCYVKNTTIHQGYSTAIAVYSLKGLSIQDSVIHGTVGSAIITESEDTTIDNVFITHVQIGATYRGRKEPYNFNAPGGIEALKATNLVMRNVAVAGAEKAAYRGKMEPSDNPNPWYNNHFHSSLNGAVLFKGDKITEPASWRFANFTIWRCFDFGLHYQRTLSLLLTKSKFIENGMSAFVTVVGPDAITHQIGSETYTVKDVLYVGQTPAWDCSQDDLVMSDYKIRSSGMARGLKLGSKGRLGAIPAMHMIGDNAAPSMPWKDIMNYPSLFGLTTFEDITFADFNNNTCGYRDVALVPNPVNDDGNHPFFVKNVEKFNVHQDNYIYYGRPRVGKVNPSDCVDMDCDGLKKMLAIDEDGSFTGSVSTVISQSEWEWGGDSRRGLGDYRIPKTMLAYPNGTKMEMSDLFDERGIIREGPNGGSCTYDYPWQAYQCQNIKHRMLIIESMDPDTESRRLSPVAVLCWFNGHKKYIDLINGPQDHGWCSGYTCQKRLSTFMAIVAIGSQCKLYFSSTSPQKLRFHLLQADANDAIVLQVFYTSLHRLDVTVGGTTVIQPTNMQADNTLAKPTTPTQYRPTTSDPAGTNFLDNKELHLTVKGSTPHLITMSQVVVIAFGVPPMSVDEFFGPKLVSNLATMLGLPSSKIRIMSGTGSSSNSGRRKRSTQTTTIEVEIGNQPNEDGSSRVLSYSDLNQVSAGIIEAFQTGVISSLMNVTIEGISVIDAVPSADSPEWNLIVNNSGQIENVIPVPTSIQIVTQPVGSTEATAFTQQPVIRMLDQNGDPITILGTSLNPWRVNVSLQSSVTNAVLNGTTSITFVNGIATFTDLSLSHAGDHTLNFEIVYPTSVSFSISSNQFTVAQQPFKIAITSSPSEGVTGTGFNIQVELRHGVTDQRITDLQGFTWQTSISLVSSTVYTGSLSGNTTGVIDSTTSQYTLQDLQVNAAGIVYLQVTAVTTDNRYSVQSDVISVTVYTAQQAAITVTRQKTIVLSFDLDYNTYNTPDFVMTMYNFLVNLLPNRKISGITLSEGSVLVTAVIGGNTTSVDSAVTSVCTSLSSDSTVTYNGQTLTMSKSLTVDGKDYYSECQSSSSDESSKRIGLIIGIIVGILGIAIIVCTICLWKCIIRPKTQTHKMDEYGQKDDQLVKYLGTSYFVDTKFWREDTFNSLREKSFLADSPLPPMSTLYPDSRSSSRGSNRPKSVISNSSSVAPSERLPPLKVKGRFVNHRFF